MNGPTEVLSIDSCKPDPAVIARAAAVLRSGGLVAFPTETVYGLGANALDPQAVSGIFRAKGRPANNPLIVHVAEAAAARELTTNWPATAQQLVDRFWPGPLSLVLPKSQRVPGLVTAGAGTVALRMPAHPVAIALIEAAGVPLAAPSANRSNLLSPTRAGHVLKGLDGRIDLVLDGGPTSGGLESTVVDLSVDPPRLLRPGLITHGELEAVIGDVVGHDANVVSNAAPLPSPGMMARHYAPRAILECTVGPGEARVRQLQQDGALVGWLRLHNDSPLNHALTIQMPPHPAGYSARLYAALHELDEAGVERIVVELPPTTDEWLAVHDRLRRASSEG